MNIKNQNRFRMIQATLGFLKNSPAAIKTLIPLIVIATSALETLVTSILSAIAEADAVTEGTTLSKTESREDLFNVANSVALAIIAHADSTGNTNLEVTLKQKLKLLQRIGQAVFLSRCKDIRDIAEANVADLSHVGVTQAVIDLLSSRILTYAGLQNLERQEESVRSASLISENKLIADAMRLLKKQTDPLVYSLTGDDTSVYKDSYRSVRKIFDLGHKKTQFKGASLNKVTNEIVTDVKVEFILNGEVVDTVYSDYNGKYKAPVNPDTYVVRASKDNFEPFIIENQHIQPGEIKVENFEMIPTK